MKQPEHEKQERERRKQEQRRSGVFDSVGEALGGMADAIVDSFTSKD